MLSSIFLGHLVGDYLLQNDWMALNKGRKNPFGWLTCGTHTVVYSLAVCAFTKFSLLWFILVCLSHYFIDHYSLAEYWSKYKGNQTLKEYMTAPTYKSGQAGHVNSAFKAFVYIVQDNTMHLVLMWWFWNWFII